MLQDAYFLITNVMNVRRTRLHAFAAVQLISSLFWNLARRHVANWRRARYYIWSFRGKIIFTWILKKFSLVSYGQALQNEPHPERHVASLQTQALSI